MEADVNDYMKMCLEANGYDRNLPIEQRLEFDFRKSAKCALDHRVVMYMEENNATADFLKANPHFRYPGGSNGNLSPCWGRDKRYTADGRC